jgi:hypothetical protein
MGKVKGDVSGPSIHISPTGALDGTVRVKELCSEGELAGSVDADMVQLSGRVRDNTVIRASSIEVKLERSDGKMEIVFGDCQLEVGAEPDKQAAIAAALRSDSNATIMAAMPVEHVAATVLAGPSVVAAAQAAPASAPSVTPPAAAPPAATSPASAPPPTASAAEPSVTLPSRRRAEVAASEAKSLPTPESWGMPQDSNADAGLPEAATAESGEPSGNGQERRERRRRGTLPPPPG